MSDLRKRCHEQWQKMHRDAMLRQGSPVDDLMAFVIAETGRAADNRLDDTLPLCLYFGSKAERDEFVDIVRAEKPNMLTRKLP